MGASTASMEVHGNNGSFHGSLYGTKLKQWMSLPWELSLLHWKLPQHSMEVYPGMEASVVSVEASTEASMHVSIDASAEVSTISRRNIPWKLPQHTWKLQ